MPTRGCPRAPESGFALLFVFLLAGFIAIALYREIPRVVFEGQRVKEDTLIQRGEQYKRAIQLYFRKLRRYPPNLEALDNTNNIRFLRKRYKDPMTGEEEWRLIHVGPGGVFLDSLVQKGPKPEESKGEASQNTFISEGPAVGSTLETAGASGPAALRYRRPSEGGAPLPGQQPEAQESTQVGQPVLPAAGQQPGSEAEADTEGEPGSEEQTEPGAQPQPGAEPVQPSQQPESPQPGQPFQPGQPQPGFFPQPVPGQPGAMPGQPVPFQPGAQPYQFPRPPVAPGQAQAQPFFPPQPLPNQPAPFSQPLQQSGAPDPGALEQPQTGGVTPAPFIGGPPAPASSPSRPGAVAPLGQNPPGQNPAAELIKRMLTTPNPRGFPGARAGQVGGQQIAGGIAGVASKLESEGIKIYNDRNKYNEWEFVYDFRKDPLGARLAVGAGARGQLGQQPGGQSPGTSPFPPGGPSPQAPGPFRRGRR